MQCIIFGYKTKFFIYNFNIIVLFVIKNMNGEIKEGEASLSIMYEYLVTISVGTSVSDFFFSFVGIKITSHV